jgi:hypothetical protein
MTREEVMNELKDICAVIDEDGELVAEDSLDALATKLMEEGSEDISEEELDAINGMIYDSFAEPATICNELINMLMSSGIQVEDIEDPLMADMWDDLSDEEVAALTAEGPNYAEFSDHHYQEGCEGGECKEAVEADQDEPKEELPETEEAKQDVEEGYYGKDSIIDGDIPGKTNTFYQLISMRFHNMGYDEESHPLLVSEDEWGDWNPFGDDGLVMFGPDEQFFDKIVRYIESEVDNEGSAWYNRDYEVCQVEGKRADASRFDKGQAGPWALCIEARDYDRQVDDIADMPLPDDIRAEYARRRKLRRGSKSVA